MQISYCPRLGGTVTGTPQIVMMRDQELWEAVCPALNLVATGETEEEATTEFGYVLEMFLEFYIGKPELLHEELISLGWVKSGSSFSNPSHQIG